MLSWQVKKGFAVVDTILPEQRSREHVEEMLAEEGIQPAAATFVLSPFERSTVHDKQKLRETVNAVKACADGGTTLCQRTNPIAYHRWMTIRQLGENGKLPPEVLTMLVQELGDDWAAYGRPTNNKYKYDASVMLQIVEKVLDCVRSWTSVPHSSTTYRQWNLIIVDWKQSNKATTATTATTAATATTVNNQDNMSTTT